MRITPLCSVSSPSARLPRFARDPSRITRYFVTCDPQGGGSIIPETPDGITVYLLGGGPVRVLEVVDHEPPPSHRRPAFRTTPPGASGGCIVEDAIVVAYTAGKRREAVIVRDRKSVV